MTARNPDSAQTPLRQPLCAAVMADYEEDPNPFRTEIDDDLNALDVAPTVSQFKQDEPPSPATPTPQASHLPMKSSFPTPPNLYSHFKQREGFCCSKDRYLNTADDAEILVSGCQPTITQVTVPADHRRAEDRRKLQ